MDDLSRQSSLDGFQLNEAKCKELRIGFSNSNHDFEPLVLNGKPLELVTSAKLLGVTISHDLKWNMHSSELEKLENVPLVSTFYVNSRDPEWHQVNWCNSM